ncbi:PAP2 family protein [Geofilum sp. OHC36d9]|uniref:PAP2 family protein n=1 Tax=Geofilum sp. OHC36d9 TaxID=3458413 RepID=UPI00403426F5
MKSLSRIISFLFHPMLMPLLGIFIIFNSGTHLSFLSFDAQRVIYITVLLATLILPASLLPLFYQFRIIQTFNMQTARERLLPLVVTAVFNYLGLVLLRKMGLSGVINHFLFASLLAITISAIITTFWKISLHMLGIGGIVGLIIALSIRYNLDLTLYLILLLMVAGITASARLELGAHKPSQIYTGFLLGVIITIITILWY